MAGGYRSRFVPYVGGVSGASAFVPQAGGRRAIFGWWFGGFAGAGTPPPPPPPPASTVGSGGWEYDPFRRRKKRIEDDEPPIVPSVPPDIPGAEPAGPLVDLGLIRQRIAGLETQIERHKLDAAVSGELRRKLEALQHRQRLAEDDDWFILLN